MKKILTSLSDSSPKRGTPGLKPQIPCRGLETDYKVVKIFKINKTSIRKYSYRLFINIKIKIRQKTRNMNTVFWDMMPHSPVVTGCLTHSISTRNISEFLPYYTASRPSR